LIAPSDLHKYFSKGAMKKYNFVVGAIVLVLLFGIESTVTSYAQSTVNPELPRVFLSTSYPATSGAILNVPAGGNLQTALNSAQPGDTVVLQAGAVYTGNFTLPAKTGSGWIVIRTSNLAGIAQEGERVSPAHAAAMPKIVSPNAGPALATMAGAHHYRLVGLEVRVAASVSLNHGLVALGDGGPAQNSLDAVPHNIVIDRCYIHGNPTGELSRGVALNSASTAIIDSYISECHGLGYDTQAICGWNGPGPFKIVNNYLEGAGENVMFGGVDPRIPNLVPSDIEFRRNYCSKPLSWNPLDPSYAGIHWSVKNIFELKNAQRVLVDGNVFENCWVDGQTGVAILFTPRNQEGTAPWSAVQDVTFTNNIVRHSAAAVHVLGRDYIFPSQQAVRIDIKNNLFDDIGGSRWGANGRLFQIIDGPANIRIDHNTAFHTSNVITADGGPSSGFVFTNNITPNNDFGVIGSGRSSGSDTISFYFPGCHFMKNVIIAGPSFLYPAGSFFPPSVHEVGFVNLAGEDYQLASGSPYKNAGTDGRDIGADLLAIGAAIGGQQQPPSNRAPQASIEASAMTGAAPLAVNFSAVASDPDGQVVGYRWDFGDGQSSTEPTASHVYQAVGTFTARLTVTDDGGASASASATVTVNNPPMPSGSEIVLYASEAGSVVGNWRVEADSTAATGFRMRYPNAGAARLDPALAKPLHYFDLSFTAQAGVGYRLWMRGKADSNSTNNDSVWVQFSDSLNSSGQAVYRINTTSATMFNLEDCTGCGLSGWGWNDNTFGGMGPLIYFATTGTHTIRVQMREDGLAIDQIVLSPQLYLSHAPGAAKNDSTILSRSGQMPAPVIFAVSPSSGSTAGGQGIKITGTGFLARAIVTIGGTPATQVSVLSGNSITAIAPPHAAGTVDVVVTNTDGQSSSLANGYTYLASNQPPQASIEVSATAGAAPLAVNFSAIASDPDGSVASYRWDFGDGHSSAEPTTSHVYQAVGAFTARLTVTDDRGASASASVVITVTGTAKPVVQVRYPNGGETFVSGSTYRIEWSVTGSNIVRQDIQVSLDGGVTWSNVITKLAGTATSYSWRVPRLSSRAARIRVRATDSRGGVGEDRSDANFVILPKR
jgi:PKD repeat protein